MELQGKRMCKTESGFSGVTVDYANNNNNNNINNINNSNNHRGYDEDCFGDILNMFDLPMECLEGDGFAEDWAAKLGPIPSEVFKELATPTVHTGVADNFGYSVDLPFQYPVFNTKASQQHCSYPTTSFTIYKAFDEEKKPYLSHAAFHAPSPNSVLESRTSSSNNKGVSFGIEISIPVRTRSKRLRPTTNPWLMSPFTGLPNKVQKTKNPSQNIIQTKGSVEKSELSGIKKCAHCEITKTPQWREGPMGPKTLCNACGVRYRSGRLYPEYRPAASPTFVPELHSNSHRKVIEMRQKAVK